MTAESHITKSYYKYIQPYIRNNFSNIEIINGVKKVVYICWFGHNLDYLPNFTTRRFNALVTIIKNIGVPIIIITKDNYKYFEVKEHPIHPAFKYLSGNHKSDYLRAYMLYHHGGGYHDIKFREKSWNLEWNKFSNPNIWMIGRRELNSDCIGYVPGNEWIKEKYQQLVTMGWIISRPQTEYLSRLLNAIHNILDNKLNDIINNPAIQPRQEHQIITDKSNYLYPLRWLEIMGEIMHPLQLEYTQYIDYSLPDILYKTYK